MSDPILPDLLSAWTARDWYGLAVLVVVLVMRVLTATDAWSRVPRSLQWLPPVVMGATAGLVDAWSSGAPWQLAIVQAVAAGLQIGLGAVGVYHAAKRFPAPSGSGGAVAILLAVALAGGASTACAPRPGQAPVASAQSPARIAYDSARLALATLDALEDQRLAELERGGYTAADLERAKVRSQRLQLAHAALTAAHEHLLTGEAWDLRTALRDAVGLLRQLAADPAVPTPQSVRQGIAMAEAWLGGDGGS